MNKMFEFPDDKNKTPLVAFTVKKEDIDFKRFKTNVMFESFGQIAFLYLGAVLAVLILLQIAITAIAAGQPFLAVCYVVFGLLAAALQIINSKKISDFATKAPNDSREFSYAFYKHHFTFKSDYEGLSESYENIIRASEDIICFIFFRDDGKAFFIPKKSLDDKQRSMLHAVMQNKLGSKFAERSV